MPGLAWPQRKARHLLERGSMIGSCSSARELHEPLTEKAWGEDWARDAIRGIVADADASFDPVGLWPAEEWDVIRGYASAEGPLRRSVGRDAGGSTLFDVAVSVETEIDLTAAARRTLEPLAGGL